MSKQKRVKEVKDTSKPAISAEDVAQIEAVYSIRAGIANGIYLTPIMQAKSTVVRLTFTEYNFTLNKHIPSQAIVMTIEDVQNCYNALTELLQKMRELGRID